MAAAARSALFVPATQPERIPKALASGADRVVVDLEDAIDPQAKDSAREALCAFLGRHPQARLWVRINDASSAWHENDLSACRQQSSAIAGILLPKAENPAQVRHVAQTGIAVLPIIESAAGLLNAAAVAGAQGVERLAFGSLDYGLDLQLNPDSPGAATVLDHARVQVLLQSRAAGLAAPLDGVFSSVRDLAGMQQAARRAHDMGFGGMLCIHPDQVALIHAAYAPAQADVTWARSVLRTYRETGAGAFMLEGKMVDAPVIARARTVLERAGETV